jgi:AcrR family transcriptional regulator
MTLVGKRKRVVKRPEDRRQDLLDAGVRVMREKGISATTIADIAQAGGVAKGTFYLYFRSKEHLLAALRERFVHETLEHGSELFARVGHEDWWGLVDTTIESFVDFMLAHRDAIEIFTQEGLSADTKGMLAECERKLNWMFAMGIQAGIQAGAFHVGDPEMAAAMIHHGLEGTLLEAILYEPKPDRERICRAAKELVQKALA